VLTIQTKQGEDKRLKSSTDKLHGSSGRDPYNNECKYKDVEPFDEIRIWNELLTARVLRTRRKRFVFANDEVPSSWRTVSNVFEVPLKREGAMDNNNYLYDDFEHAQSNEVYGETPPLIPIKPPDTVTSVASDVNRPIIDCGQTFFVTSDAGIAEPQPGMQKRSWNRRNGIIISEAEHAMIMLKLQQRDVRPLDGNDGKGTAVVFADSERGIASERFFDTNDPISSGSDTGDFEMTDELDDDIEPQLEKVAATVNFLVAEERSTRQSLPPPALEAALKEDSSRNEILAPVLEMADLFPGTKGEEMDQLLGEESLSLETALLMEDDPVDDGPEVHSIMRYRPTWS